MFLFIRKLRRSLLEQRAFGRYLRYALGELLLVDRYYGDLLFYRTALNNTNLFLQEQRRLGDSLAGLIRESYGLD